MIVETLILTLPPTIAALAAWRASNKAVRQTNGHLEGPLARIEAKIENVLDWQTNHERAHRADARLGG